MTSTAAPPPTVDFAPRLSQGDVEALAREAWQLDGRATELPSDRDQNFLITDEIGRQLVLKIANSRERREVLEGQQALLQHLSTRLDLSPRVIAAANGETIVEVTAPDGLRHLAWAISWLDGWPMAKAVRQTPAMLEEVGARAAALREALNGFDHPALHRDIQWDLAHGRELVRGRRPDIADAALGAAIDHVVSEYDRLAAPHLAALPRATIHGDLNDHNILVDGSAGVDGFSRVSGIVDYGDAVHSFAVADLAIAVAYALLGADDPLAAACEVVRGYARVSALSDEELAALYGLVVLRLAMSACIAAEQQRLRPDNAYLGVSQDAIARQLPVLAALPFALAEAAFRSAAGRSATRHGQRVVDFLRHRASYEPVLPFDLRREPTLVLDLGVASPLIDGDPARNDEPMLTARVEAVMRSAAVRVAVGQYDEPRLIYVAPAFALGPRVVDEHRTIHIGLDLFADAGTPVFAPLAGSVHAFADNAARQDYGPVIVLRHSTDDGADFFTLYGHLSRESLRGLTIGQPVRAGERIATLGGPEVNGGWTPHLHLQIMVDALGLDTDFPGVAPPSYRALWCELCPDPNLIVGVPASCFPAPASGLRDTLDRRHTRVGKNLSIAYREPVRVVRGWMQYLYDDEGRRYLDAYNNVPHVGHCHRRVVEAGAEQMRVLNTNTRYLNDLLAAYAERLTATLPRPLDVCYFVSSASEANELAIRLARAYTGARDVVVLEGAYHGNTTSLIDVSPYKHAGPGGGGAPDWVHVAPLADDYRGPFKRDDRNAGERYAAQVADVVGAARAGGRSIAAFLAETCPSVGGQIVFPPGY
jgi:Ser/Thr protein kinase RdoA (MazF antagonist)